jgi:hypothetical protein
MAATMTVLERLDSSEPRYGERIQKLQENLRAKAQEGVWANEQLQNPVARFEAALSPAAQPVPDVRQDAHRQRNVVVNGLAGEMATLTVPEVVKVQFLKESLATSLGVPVVDQRLYLGTQELADDGADFSEDGPLTLVCLPAEDGLRRRINAMDSRFKNVIDNLRTKLTDNVWTVKEVNLFLDRIVELIMALNRDTRGSDEEGDDELAELAEEILSGVLAVCGTCDEALRELAKQFGECVPE